MSRFASSLSSSSRQATEQADFSFQATAHSFIESSPVEIAKAAMESELNGVESEVHRIHPAPIKEFQVAELEFHEA